MALIDKEAALAEMDYLISAKKLVEDILEARGIEIETVPKLIRFIKAQPRQEKKRGRWIQHKAEGWEGGGVTRCNYCNYGYAWGAFFEVENFNYCPNCGAHMEGEQ